MIPALLLALTSVSGGKAAADVTSTVRAVRLERPDPVHVVIRMVGTAPPRLSVRAHLAPPGSPVRKASASSKRSGPGAPFYIELDWFGSDVSAAVPVLGPGWLRRLSLESRRAEREPVSRLRVEFEQAVDYSVRAEGTTAELWLRVPDTVKVPWTLASAPVASPEPARLRGPFPLPAGLEDRPGALRERPAPIPEEPPGVALERPILVSSRRPPSPGPRALRAFPKAEPEGVVPARRTLRPVLDDALPAPLNLVTAPKPLVLPPELQGKSPLQEPDLALPTFPEPVSLEPLGPVVEVMPPSLRRPSRDIPRRALPSPRGASTPEDEGTGTRPLARFTGGRPSDSGPDPGVEPAPSVKSARLATFAPADVSASSAPAPARSEGPELRSPRASERSPEPTAPPTWVSAAARPENDDATPGPRVLTYIGFQHAGGTSRVFVRLDGRARFRAVPNPAPDTFVLELKDTSITVENNTRPLDTSFFPGPVGRVQAKRIGAHVHVEVRLRSAAKWTIKRVGTTVAIDFVDDR